MSDTIPRHNFVYKGFSAPLSTHPTTRQRFFRGYLQMPQQVRANAPPHGSQDNYGCRTASIYTRRQQAVPDSGAYISDKSMVSSSGRASPQAWYVRGRGYGVPVVDVLDGEERFFCERTAGQHGCQYVVLPPKGLDFATPVVEKSVFKDYGSAKLLADYYRDLEVGVRRERAPEVRYGSSGLIAEMENGRFVAHACIEYLLTCLPFCLYAPLFADEKFLENSVAMEPITLSTVAIAAHVLRRFTKSGKFGEFTENKAVREQLEEGKVRRWETSFAAWCRIGVDMLVTNALTLGIQWCEDVTYESEWMGPTFEGSRVEGRCVTKLLLLKAAGWMIGPLARPELVELTIREIFARAEKDEGLR